MNIIIINPCQYSTKNCMEFNKVNNLIIKMINNHYFDLQMYANFVFDIDNYNNNIKDNNIYQAIENTRNKYIKKFPHSPLFSNDNMILLKKNVLDIIDKLPSVKILSKIYFMNMLDIYFYGCGSVSSSIFLKFNKQISNTHTMPIVTKIFPIQYPHHYEHIPIKHRCKKKKFIKKFIEIPLYALFLKEAWMYCFAKNNLLNYLPTIMCVSSCYIIKGFPISDISTISQMYNVYLDKNPKKKKYHKKWLDIIIDPNANNQIKKKIMQSNYGCFEMKLIEGTLSDIIKNNEFDLSLLFEYLYTKVIVAFIGRIIFTDDHIENIAYIHVDYYRKYNIISYNKLYTFYMPPGKMIQFIDLERYVFNFTRNDVYTNTAMKMVSLNNSDTDNDKMIWLKKNYQKNNYIYDKTLRYLVSSVKEINFKKKKEYNIMLNILHDPLLHNVKMFCKLLHIYLPTIYLVAPEINARIVEYNINLDDDSIRVINVDDVCKY